MGVSQKLQELNFALHTASHVAADELLARDDLESHLLACGLVNGQLHFAKGALAQGADDGVLVEPGVCGPYAVRQLRRAGAGTRLGGAIVGDIDLRRLLTGDEGCMGPPALGARQGNRQLLVFEPTRAHGGRLHRRMYGSKGGGEEGRGRSTKFEIRERKPLLCRNSQTLSSRDDVK